MGGGGESESDGSALAPARPPFRRSDPPPLRPPHLHRRQHLAQLRRGRPGGRQQLHQHRAAAQLRPGGQQRLERPQFQLQPFEHVQIVSPHEHNLARELGHQLAPPPHRLRPAGEAPAQAGGVDAGGADLDHDLAAVVVNPQRPPPRLVRQAEHAGAAGEEVAGVVEGVEADHVAVQGCAQQRLSGGERAEHLGRGEGAVEEEGEAQGVEPFAQEGGEEPEVVVVHPDVVLLGGDHLHQHVPERFVRGQVGTPQGPVEAASGGRAEGQQVVQQGPQRLLAEPVVELVLQLRAQVHWKGRGG